VFDKLNEQVSEKIIIKRFKFNIKEEKKFGNENQKPDFSQN
jgi:hypothetical protein